jgi:hypothetical protein
MLETTTLEFPLGLVSCCKHRLIILTIEPMTLPHVQDVALRIIQHPHYERWC